MRARGQRGMVLVACLLLLALLSLLGASSLFTATVDTQFVGNLKQNRQAFYAAEAALEVGTGTLTREFLSRLRPYQPGYAWTNPQGTGAGDPYANPFNGYTTQYRIGNALDASNRASIPAGQPYSTVQNGQQLIHYAYMYSVEGKAEGALGSASMSESVRILETPLVQYYVFFNDHLSWHPGAPMDSWGRIHANGNLYFAPQAQVSFRDYNDPAAPQFSPNQLTVSGEIRYGEYLGQDGGVLTRASSPVRVRVLNLGTAPAAGGDYVNVDQHITASNRGVQEARFADAGTPPSYHVRVGVDPLPTPSSRTIQRGDYYESEAAQPTRTLVDGFLIHSDSGALHVLFTPSGGAQRDVTSWVENYQVDAGGNPISFARWQTSADALVRANGSTAANLAELQAVPRTIVYSPEAFVERDEAGTVYGAWHGAGKNPSYPCVLERQDGREAKEVDLTVIDLQRLQLWYRDYLDWADNGAFDGSVNLAPRKLLIYVSRTNATVRRAGALQAVKLVGSRAGRTRGAAWGTDRQSSATLVVPTTVVTDNPIYLEGDFNAPSAAAGSMRPGTVGCAVICDAVTLLSNNWGTAGASGPLSAAGPAQGTAFNAAFFAGRYDFRNHPAAGEEAGIHNFVRFLENWNPAGTGAYPCFLTGSLINLWWSTQATARHSTSYYSPPARNFGWDVGFANRDYWPPYTPSIYTLERTAWRGQ